MKFKEFWDIILEINEKFNNYDSHSEDYCEILHAFLYEAVRGFSEEQYNEIPESTRFVLEKLEANILKSTSYKYQKEYENSIANFGKFKKPVISEIKQKKKIRGFVCDNEEGTTI